MRPPIRNLETKLDKLYTAVKQSIDEKKSLALGREIKRLQRSYYDMRGYFYLPRLPRVD